MFACIYIPDFPAEAIVRSEPLLRENAVAVLEGKPPLLKVMALNEKGRQLGMVVGMTKLEAALFAEPPSVASGAKRFSPHGVAVLRQRSQEQENSAYSAVLDVAHAFTPRVEDTATDTLLLDLDGMERLYGVPAKMARDLASRIRTVGIEANLALASNPDAAMYAARGLNGITVIAVGEEAQRLGVLPIHVLLDSFSTASSSTVAGHALRREQENLHQQVFNTLESWGIRDFRALALLPERALASRLGQTGVRLQRLARGAEIRTLALCEPPSHFEEVMDLESAVETIESLSFVLNRLLEQLCTRLEARALAVQELRLRLHLEARVADEATTTVQELKTSHHVEESAICQRVLRLPVSMRDSKVFLKLLQLDLAAHPPGAPVTKIWIAAEPAPPRSAQRGLFLPVTPEAEKLEITLARISGIVGERCFGIARLLNSHHPARFRIDRFVIPREKMCPDPIRWDTNASRPLALRMFRPARRLRVQLSEGRPSNLSARSEQPQGEVIWIAGPWRSSGDWWSENFIGTDARQSGSWDREEWDVALAGFSEDGEERHVALYRIYQDLATGHWFADASYD